MTSNNELDYDLRRVGNETTTGYFACVPDPDPGLEQGLELLAQRPLDDFLRKHLLSLLLDKDSSTLAQLFLEATDRGDKAVLALLREVRIIAGHSAADMPAGDDLASCSSLVYLRLGSAGDLSLHRPWMDLLRRNLVEHQPLTAASMAVLPALYDAGTVDEKPGRPDIAALFENTGPPATESDRPPVEQTLETALAALNRMDLFSGPETRHVSSLSPIAYLRKWRLAIEVHAGRNRYRLSGIQTSYGRGLSPESARVSCLMEIVERVSSFASVENTRLVHRKDTTPLVYGSFSDLCAQGTAVLDPNCMRLDVAYQNEPLFWILAQNASGTGIYVPAQAVYLFSNLDEPSLFSGLGSTGLASGNTRTEAKLAGLFEVVERDADGVVPFDPGACFELVTDNPHLQPLFDAYRARGIAIGFQQITTEFGIPCYRCFVKDSGGVVFQGTGAHLDGRKAILSALTETPYPFPSGPASGPGLAGLTRRRFESLPNYDTNNSAANLQIVEKLLLDRGFEPLYVDVSRGDLDFPVIRAIVPGLEWLTAFDRFSTVSPRLYRNCLALMTS